MYGIRTMSPTGLRWASYPLDEHCHPWSVNERFSATSGTWPFHSPTSEMIMSHSNVCFWSGYPDSTGIHHRFRAPQRSCVYSTHVHRIKLAAPVRLELTNTYGQSVVCRTASIWGQLILAGDPGFEPGDVGIKIRCLRPTWRIPYNLAEEG